MKHKLYFYNIFFLIIILFVSCNQNIKEKKDIETLIITAKYCFLDYTPSYYFEGSDSIGVNIYFAGRIRNNTEGTFYIPNRELKFLDRYEYPPYESLFYAIINGDSLFFTAMYPMIFDGVGPNKEISFNLQYYITPENPKLLEVFRNIYNDQTILDTMRIYYATPNMQLEKEGKLFPPIELERSKKFRIETAEYNSYFEQIFTDRDFYEDPPEDMD